MEPSKAVYIAPFRAGVTNGWPFDLGDDPSFHSAFTAAGRVTWGVCRRDVRRLAQPGDVLLFFSAEERTSGIFEYKFCALLTVHRKIKQTEMWRPHTKATRFQQYRNLLIRPRGDDWEHWEPGLPKKEWHKDWLSRLTYHDAETSEFTRAQARHFLTSGQADRFVDANYVVFSVAPEHSFICEKPKVIASCDAPGELESWHETKFAQELKSFTVDHTRRTLRTTNEQRPHRHGVWRTSAAAINEWRTDFMEWLRRNCRQRTSASPLPKKMSLDSVCK